MTFLYVAASVLVFAGAWFGLFCIFAAASTHHLEDRRDGGRRLTLPERRPPRSFASYHRSVRRSLRRTQRDMDRWYRGGHIR